MPTYVYELVTPDSEAEPQRFEVFQRITDDPLTSDPRTGRPVTRIVAGAIGIHLSGLKRSTVVDKRSAAATACGCGRQGAHRHRRPGVPG